MTQLAAAVNSTEELWTVDTLPTTQYVAVDDETVEISAKFPSQIFSLTGQATATQIRVHRAVGGTTAASHLINAALTPVYGLGGGAGGEQTIRLLEFPFAFDDSFVNDDYTTVHTVENACYIVYSAFITLTGWGGAGAATMSWEAVRDGQTAFVECQDVAGGGSGGAMPREFPPVSRFAMPLSAGATIGIGVWTEDVLTSGTAKLMVLIAEPAA